ncbi:MAG TPA: class I SAM-dependent methyltransferase, partial [Cyclobacteriaceae bacterium]
SESPLPHIQKSRVIKGNAITEVEKYLAEHSETLIAFAYFDFDIYEPTLKCLQSILPYMTKGGIIAFDELIDPHFPGETIALREVLGNKFSIKRMPFCGIQSYLVHE